MNTPTLIAITVLLILCGACIAASETALFSLSLMRVKAYRHNADKRKQLVAALLMRPRELLVTIIIVTIVLNILVQNTVAKIFADVPSWGLNVGLPLALTLVFGEIIPKSIALANNDRIAYRVAPMLNWLSRLLGPVRIALLYITDFVSRCLFFYLKKEEDISIDELQHTLKTSRLAGVLNEDEAELVNGYLKLKESSVKELMRPREEVLYFDIEEPISKLVHLFVDQECSRIPVCKESLDNFLGVITSKRFFLQRESFNKSEDVLPVLRKAFFVPETTDADLLLKQMYEKQESIAIVVDEYGSVSGLISLEDLVEVVVGEIADRRDEKSRYTRSGEDIIIASGKLELMELEDIFGIALSSENNMVTIGGWLTEQMGDIPKTGAKYVTENFLFHVLSADPNRVRRVYIRRLKHPSEKSKAKP